MAAILKMEPPPLAEANGKVPAAFERIVRHCLEKRPDDRFQSARDLVFALEAVRDAGPTKPIGPPWPRTSRRGHPEAATGRGGGRRSTRSLASGVVVAASAADTADRRLRTADFHRQRGGALTVPRVASGHLHRWGQASISPTSPPTLRAWGRPTYRRAEASGPDSQPRGERPAARPLARRRQAPGQRLADPCRRKGPCGSCRRAAAPRSGWATSWLTMPPGRPMVSRSSTPGVRSCTFPAVWRRGREGWPRRRAGPTGIRWSPDGRHLRFTLIDAKGHRRSLWEVSADGEPTSTSCPSSGLVNDRRGRRNAAASGPGRKALCLHRRA